ncbi:MULTISPECIES: hypothetical protein [unclassified Micromonospora]|uniref:hypothetical protein n=1 Tax=unclassified Micromonospora TaxID=2617518 RepID=UPI003325E158
MDCDYCGQATGAVAQWEVTAGVYPGDGMTRYVCGQHRESAEEHVGYAGKVLVFPTNRSYIERRFAA